MEKINFNEMQKKEVRLGIRVSEAEKKILEQFCAEMGIGMSELIRYAVRQVMNQQKAK